MYLTQVKLIGDTEINQNAAVIEINIQLRRKCKNICRSCMITKEYMWSLMRSIYCNIYPLLIIVELACHL